MSSSTSSSAAVSSSSAAVSSPPYPSLSVLPSPSPAHPPLVSSSSSTAKGVLFSDSRKRRKRHADRVLPERVEVDVPDSALFSELLALERRVDAAIAARYVQLQEALYTPQHLYQTLRLYVWHEWQHLPAGWYWTLRLLACWIDDSDGSLGAGSGAASSPLRVLGNIMQSVTIQLDPVLYPDPADGCIEWRKHSTVALTDGVELHRKEWTASGKGTAACGVKVLLVPYYSPPLFTLSSTLSRIVGLRQATHPYVLRAVWRYCTERSLLSPTDASVIVMDDALSALMDSHQSSTLQQINHRITQQHLTPAEPIQLQHSIGRPGAAAASDSVSVFDLTLPLPEMPAIANVGSHMQTTFAAFAANATNEPIHATHNNTPDELSNTAAALPATSAASSASSSPSPVLSSSAASLPPSLVKEWKDLSALTDNVSAQLSELHRLSARRDFLHAFASCPVDTINLLIAQQARHAMLALTTHRAEQAEQAVRREQAQMAAAAISAAGGSSSAVQQSAAAAGSGSHLHLAGSRSVALQGGEEEKARRGRYYAAEWMQDAVDRYLEHAKQTGSASRQQLSVDA